MFQIDAYASSGFVIDASRKRVNRYTPTHQSQSPALDLGTSSMLHAYWLTDIDQITHLGTEI